MAWICSCITVWEAVRWGSNREFIGCPRLDDLQCAFTSMKGFLAAENEQNINVYACFDNEEVGSGTKQGAASTFLYDVLWRMNKSTGKNEEEFSPCSSRKLYAEL